MIVPEIVRWITFSGRMLTLMLALALSLFLSLFGGSSRTSFVLATTTSVENSGLLRVVLEQFKAETGIEAHVLAVGSGKAIRLAESGDAQALITHDPQAEAAFVRSGRAKLYRQFMWNDFVIAGPPSDPARVRGSRSADDAFRRIFTAKAPFAARNDQSGTSTRELAIWATLGIDPRQNPRYLPLGQPMGALLRSASELRAYTLTDRPTFAQLARQVDLAIVYEGDPKLRNVYAVSLVRRSEPTASDRNAERFVLWLLSEKGRRAVEGFRIGGRQQFFWIAP